MKNTKQISKPIPIYRDFSIKGSVEDVYSLSKEVYDAFLKAGEHAELIYNSELVVGKNRTDIVILFIFRTYVNNKQQKGV